MVTTQDQTVDKDPAQQALIAGFVSSADQLVSALKDKPVYDGQQQNTIKNLAEGLTSRLEKLQQSGLGDDPLVVETLTQLETATADYRQQLSEYQEQLTARIEKYPKNDPDKPGVDLSAGKKRFESSLNNANLLEESLEKLKLAAAVLQQESKKKDEPELGADAAQEPSLKDNLTKFESYFQNGGLRTDQNVTQSLQELATLTETIQKQVQENPELDAETKQALERFSHQAKAAAKHIPLFKAAVPMLSGNSAAAGEFVEPLDRIRKSLQAVTDKLENNNAEQEVNQAPEAKDGADKEAKGNAEQTPRQKASPSSEAETGTDKGASETSGGENSSEADQDQGRGHALGDEAPEQGQEISEEERNQTQQKALETEMTLRGLSSDQQKEVLAQSDGKKLEGLAVNQLVSDVQVASNTKNAERVTKESIDLQHKAASGLEAMKAPHGASAELLASALGAVSGVKLGSNLGIADVAVQSHGTDHSTSLTHSAGGTAGPGQGAGLSGGGTQLG